MGKKILIKGFDGLSNYGNAMMGLVSIQAILDHFVDEEINIYCEIINLDEKENILRELRNTNHVHFVQYKAAKYKGIIKRRIWGIRKLLFSFYSIGFDYIIILGGDIYSSVNPIHSWALVFEFIQIIKYSLFSKVILLGHTFGPFYGKLEKIICQYMLKRVLLYVREPWSKGYVLSEWHTTIRQIPDLAFFDLPLQQNSQIEKKLFEQYQLKKDTYVTVVISGFIYNNAYCKSFDQYISQYRDIVLYLLNKAELQDKKIVLLAHTFPPSGNESELISRLVVGLDRYLINRLVLVTDQIGPTRARLILGNSFFTITGRMHAAISTFQMGKPAISLSYSVKYKGVVSMYLERSDLLIEANDDSLWREGAILNMTLDRINYLLDNYSKILYEIKIKLQTNEMEYDKLWNDLFEN